MTAAGRPSSARNCSTCSCVRSSAARSPGTRSRSVRGAADAWPADGTEIRDIRAQTWDATGETKPFLSRRTAVVTNAAPAAELKPQVGKLRVETGGNAGRELELTKALTTIGKPGVQVAAITKRSDGFYIVHVGGSAGGKRPLVNGSEIDQQAHHLKNNDVIELAGTQMRFLLV